jgi:DNA-binding XRE family transcriptional regulator
MAIVLYSIPSKFDGMIVADDAVMVASSAYDPPQWGPMVRGLRTEQHISQRELARLSQTNRSSLRRFERGVTDGSITYVQRLLYVLGYELDALSLGRRDAGRQSIAA